MIALDAVGAALANSSLVVVARKRHFPKRAETPTDCTIVGSSIRKLRSNEENNRKDMSRT